MSRAPEAPHEPWDEKVRRLTREEGRGLTVRELLEHARNHQMSPAEYEAQRQSWMLAMTTPCEHGIVDFEQCPRCRAAVAAILQETPDDE